MADDDILQFMERQQRSQTATPGGYYWWAYAAYFAVAAGWNVWPAVVAFAVVAVVMRAIYYFSRSGKYLDAVATLLVVADLIGFGVGAWRTYVHGQLVWFLAMIPLVLVGDMILALLFYGSAFRRMRQA